VIEAGKADDLKLVTGFLKNKLAGSTGFKVTVKAISEAPATIKLLILKRQDTTIGKEGYHLLVSKKGVIIKANEAAGLFHGAQTLVQLFPKEIEGLEVTHGIVWKVPCIDIKDYPRFGWRVLPHPPRPTAFRTFTCLRLIAAPSSGHRSRGLLRR
jgi:hexosaminidase